MTRTEKLEAVAKAAARVRDRLLHTGRVENHGHRRAGVICAECRDVNALDSALDAALSDRSKEGTTMQPAGESPAGAGSEPPAEPAPPICTGDTATCPDAECMDCSERDCPYADPLHYHHDGCPSCTMD